MTYWILIAVAVISFGFGWIIGATQGRRLGYMIGEEIERRKWRKR